MADGAIKASEVSDEMVALYLLASIAENEPGVVVNWHAGVPAINGMDKSDLLANYVDCLKSIVHRTVKIA